MTFGDREKRRLGPLKRRLFSERACRSGMYRGRRREFCLHEDFGAENLEAGIRDAALAYTERSKGGDLRYSRSKTDRLDIYREQLAKPDCQIRGGMPFQSLFFDPFYPLMRQQLLCTAMERNCEMEADVVTLLHVAPRANRELMRRVTSEALEGVGPDIHAVWDALTLPGRFKGAATEDLLPLVCANAPTTRTGEYLKLRYGGIA